MGAYLSEPITEKESTDEANDFLSCGASSMQGWRMSQEDAHNSILDFDKNSSFFAVYDGHGGAEVALYCAQHLPKFLRIHEQYALGNYELALREAFVDFDGTLIQERIIEELKKLVPEDKHDFGSGDESVDEGEELAELCQESRMPLEQLLEKYKEARKIAAKTAAATAAGGSSSDEPAAALEGGSSSSSAAAGASGSSSSAAAAAGCSSHNRPVRRTTATSAKAGGGSDEDEAAAADGSAGSAADAVVEATKPNAGPEDGKSNHSAEATNGETQIDENGKAAGGTDKTEANGKSDGDVKAASSAKAKTHSDDDDSDDSDDDDDDDVDKEVSFVRGAGDDDDDDDDDDEEEDEEEDDDEDEDDDDDEEMAVAADDDDDDEDSFLNNMQEGPGSSSGCTAVVALIVERELFVANAGDSRCVVCRDGQALEMSFDHKPEDEIELERIEKAGGRVTMDGRVNGGLNLSRAIGDHAYKQNKSLKPEEQMISALPDIKHITISPADEFMIIACDGIWNFMSSTDVVDFVKARINDGREKLSSICEELFTACLATNTMGDGTGCDNMTAVIVRFKSALYERPAAQTQTKKRSAPSPTATPEAPETAKRIKTDGDDATAVASIAEQSVDAAPRTGESTSAGGDDTTDVQAPSTGAAAAAATADSTPSVADSVTDA